ncbi:MAG: hypothetical protein ACN6RA_03465 [Stenotrophomonas maltophilia]
MRTNKVLNPLCMMLVLAATATAAAPVPVEAQVRRAAVANTATQSDAVMLTIHLQHDQSRPLGELREQLEGQGFYKAFPPEGVEVVSWTVAMGIGQVVVLRLPASRLAEVNLALENTAWGAYRTAFFPTYDLKDAARTRVMEARAVK